MANNKVRLLARNFCILAIRLIIVMRRRPIDRFKRQIKFLKVKEEKLYLSISNQVNVIVMLFVLKRALSFYQGLFECPAWYVGKPLAFISPRQLAKDRYFHINPQYEPMFATVDPNEDERGYYQRSAYLIEKIVENHKAQGGTILLSGHGGSIEAVTRRLRGAFHRRGRPERLIEVAGRVDYCNFAILERDARTHRWTVHLPESSNRSGATRISLQSSIPLYSVFTRTHPKQTSVEHLSKRYFQYGRSWHPHRQRV
jgi:broad specificity phosphatase PhoE